MKKFNYVVLLVVFLAFFSGAVFSQDHHYWSQQFGSRSALMGGAVVGGVRDTSASFYNPGALGFLNQPSLSVSANAYQLEKLSIDNGAGTDSSLNSEKISIIPLLASGTLVLEPLPNHTFSYSLLAKNKSAIDMSGRVDKKLDLIGNIQFPDGTVFFDGEENFIGQVIANSDVTELWGGLSWAYQMNPAISIGTTAFLALRNQSQNQTLTARAINNKTITSVDRLNYIDFWNLRSLLKLGIASELERLKMGLTLTTPSLNFFGQGTVAAERNFNNFYAPEQHQFVGELVSNRQENLDITYKTPLSIALGVEYAVTKDTNLAGTLEWFAKQPTYDVITPGSYSFLRNIIIDEFVTFDEDTAERSAIIQVQDAAESAVNFGIAIEHTLTNEIKGYLSFRTDRETNANLPGNSLGIIDWDIYHLTAGATFRRKRSELAIGMTYSFGTQNSFKQLANFAQIQERDLIGTTQNTSAQYNALSLIVGYTYFFDIK
jgi:hypothetical protein